MPDFPFREEAGISIPIPIQSQHITTHTRRANGEWQVDCSCGALWTHKADETEERMSSIYQSHLSYFNRPPTQVL